MKNYDWAIEKKFGELTILSYTMPIKEHKYQRDCVCLCSCGKKIVTRLNRVLRGDTIPAVTCVLKWGRSILVD